MSLSDFLPKSIQFLRHYTFPLFRKDLLAGLTVGIIALPLAMAFAIASGVTPERGLFTAIVAGFLISLLGGSRVQIGGPTGAFVIIVYGIVQRTGYEGLCMSTLIAAGLLVLLGVFKIGSWIKYVPQPLVVGFTSGIALVIFSTQMRDFFGLQMSAPPAEFVEKWAAYIQAFPTMHGTTLLVASGTVGLIVCIRKFFRRAPWGICAILVATVLCTLFQIPVETIHSRFGEIPRMLPVPSWPSFSMPTLEILSDALAIAFLGGIESLLSAVVGDRLSGGKHRSNCELVAQGLANVGSIMFGGIPATGGIARTVANVKSGGQTPVAGMVHAVTLLCVLVFLAPVVSLIPLAALAAVLVVVSWNMSELGHFVQIFRSSMQERILLLTAFFLTVLVDITTAITAGMILVYFFRLQQPPAREPEVDSSGQHVSNHQDNGP